MLILGLLYFTRVRHLVSTCPRHSIINPLEPPLIHPERPFVPRHPMSVFDLVLVFGGARVVQLSRV
jgi:hypothetical protein